MKFELHVANNDVSSGNIIVSFCLDKDGLDFLANQKITDPAVVICVAPVNGYSSKKEVRKIVPLKDLIAYIDFRCAGENKIYGFVCEGVKSARNKYLKRENDDFSYDILLNSGDDYACDSSTDFAAIGYNYLSCSNSSYDNMYGDTPYEKRGDRTNYLVSEPIHVAVPSECFAPEPLDKEWVNHFYKSKVVDQCEFRRRRMFAYSLQPIVMIGNMLLRCFLITIAALLASKTFNLRPLLHPLSLSLDDAANTIIGRNAFLDESKSPNSIRNIIGRMCTPIIFLGEATLITMIIHLFMMEHRVRVFLMMIVVLSITIVGIIQFIKFLSKGSDKLESFVNILNAILSPLDWAFGFSKNKKFTPWYSHQEEHDLIVCDFGKTKPKTVYDLPSKHKTVRLRFQDLKTKVCKPFSR